MTQSPSPANGTSYGRGQYASPDDTNRYLERFRRYLRERGARWLDRWTDARTGDVRAGVRDLSVWCNEWRADNHIVKWAIQQGWLDPTSMPDPKGQKNRQIGRYSAIVYFASIDGRRAITRELERYIDRLESEEAEQLESLNGQES